MTIRKALKIIRANAPETEDTFMTIRRNRYCNGVRYWSIYDIQKAENPDNYLRFLTHRFHHPSRFFL